MIRKLDLKFLYFLLIILILFLFFFERLGSDDIEVFNFVKHFIISDLSLKDFLTNLHLYIENVSEKDGIQLFNSNTWNHRFVWIFQTYLVTKTIYAFNLFWDFDKIFVAQYFSGYILTIYSFSPII